MKTSKPAPAQSDNARWHHTGTFMLPVDVSRAQWIGQAAATIALVAAAIVLAGWIFDAPALTSFGRPWTPMVATTALAVAAGAIAVLALARVGPLDDRAVRGAGAFMLVMGVVVLADHVSMWVRGAGLYMPSPAWRTAPSTALAVTFIGLALVRLNERRRRRIEAEVLLILAVLIAATMLLAFMLGATPRSELMGRVNMSPITGLLLAFLTLPLLLLLPGGVTARVVQGAGPGSQVARRLLGLVIVGPVAIGWMRLLLERRGFITVEYGIAIMVLGTTVLATLAIGWGALRVNRYAVERDRLLDDARTELARRQEAEASLRALTAELERRVAERTAQLAVTNRELESFSYSVSHDLRTPLRALDGFSQALIEDYGDRLDDSGRDYLQRIRRGSQRMAGLIDALLELSRVSRGQLQREAVDLTAVANDILHSLRETAPQRAVSVRVQEGLTATGDPRLLRALLQNLLANAWKFTSKQPNAMISFTREPHPGRGEPVFLVRDNGAGFDMAYADKLFGAFQRLHTTEFEGTGVGLATAQRIVHRHAGDIWAGSAPGEGATFYFTLS